MWRHEIGLRHLIAQRSLVSKLCNTTPSESAFLERAVVQLLFVSGREFSLESLREKLRELFVQEPDATVRAAASIGGFELLQALLKTTQKLEKLGLRLDIRAGSVRITTAEVRPLPCATISPRSPNNFEPTRPIRFPAQA